MDVEHKSKVDWWIGLLLVWVAIVPLVVIGASVQPGRSYDVVPGVISLLVSWGILGGLVFPMRYTLTRDALVVRFGLVRVRVPYDRIRAVAPSSNPLSSPALSLQRVRIDYDKPNGKGTFVLVSPQDRDGFIRELRQRAGVDAA